MTNNKNVQSVERALLLLEALANAPDGMSIKQLSEQTMLNKSTVHRLLQTLKSFDYVQQDTRKDYYHLSVKILTLSTSLLESLDVRIVSRPLLKELCDTTGETINLSIRNNVNAIYIDKIENSARTIRMYSQIGRSIPLYCSASGKALIAWMPENDVRALMSGVSFKKLTKTTIPNLDALISELEIVREQGYATDWFEHENGIFCVAAPIFDSTNNVIAAISIAGTLLVLTPERFFEFSRQINHTASLISARMGCKTYPAVFKPQSMSWNPYLNHDINSP